MQKTMKAAVVRAFGKPLAIEEIPVPEPGPGEVLVKVIACGVCHTDLHAADGDWPVKPNLPFVPGHEITGVVAALGPGVTSLKEGDPGRRRLAARLLPALRILRDGMGDPLRASAQHRLQLRRRFRRICHRQRAVRGQAAGRMSITPAWPRSSAPGVTTYKGLKETEAKPGEWVAISGVGGLGHLAIQYAKAMGLHVAALDVAADKLALAKATGAEVVVDARSPRRRRNIEGDRRRGARSTGHCRVAARLFASAAHGSPEGNGCTCRAASRRLSDPHLRRSPQANYRPRLDRRHPP